MRSLSDYREKGKDNGNGTLAKALFDHAFQRLDGLGLKPRSTRGRVVFLSPIRPEDDPDHNPSGYMIQNSEGVLTFGDGGSTLEKGEQHRQIRDKLGLSEVDTCPKKHRAAAKNAEPFELFERNVLPYPLHGQVVATHCYWVTNHDGSISHLLAEKLRTKPQKPGDRKGFAWRRPIGDKVTYTLKPGKHPATGMLYGAVRPGLYNQPEVFKASTVYFVEGEKVADRLMSVGLTATTNAGGADEWDEGLVEQLRQHLSGKIVIVSPDNDEKGKLHAQRVARSLVGYASKVILLPPLPSVREKGDVVDWFDENGKTVDDFAALVAATPPLEPIQQDGPATDDTHRGNSELLAHLLNGRWIHDSVTRTDYLFQKTHWEDDPAGKVRLLASDALSGHFYTQVEEIKDLDPKLARELAKRARSMGDKRVLDCVLAFARAEPQITRRSTHLNADRFLFNAANGTFCTELERWGLRPHDPADHITRCSPVTYDAQAECPKWLACLDRWFAGDPALIKFMRQYLGYCCLTGDVSAQHLLICWGDGNNGKNVLFNLLFYILGAYASSAPPEMLEASKQQRHPTEVMDLKDKWLVVASESESGATIRTQFIKRATGDDVMKGRFMRADFVEFARTFKLILVTNNKPRITENTHAMWRRILLVHFGVIIPESEIDPDLLKKLKIEASGVLNWLLEGCREWQENGKRFDIPESVRVATREYREEQNPVGQFIEERCELGQGPEFKVPSVDLYTAYKVWSEAQGNSYPLTATKFNDAMRHATGLENKKIHWPPAPSGKAAGWMGIRVLPDATRPRF
jgi:putative DNA primase/helicase